jgi:hypothetical protein
VKDRAEVITFTISLTCLSSLVSGISIVWNHAKISHPTGAEAEERMRDPEKEIHSTSQNGILTLQ